MSIVATAIDPRDTTWLENQPAYRAYIFDKSGASEEWRLTDVHSVCTALEWAESNSSGRDFVFYVEVRTPQGTGLVRLAGQDPNEL
jgi:hypothetical protein